MTLISAATAAPGAAATGPAARVASRAGKAFAMRVGGRVAVAALVLAGAASTVSCAAPVTPTAPSASADAGAAGGGIPSSSPADAMPSASATPAPTAAAAALVERDAFIQAQQQPLGQGALTAKTPAQVDLVSQQRAHVEEQGLEWSAAHETITLALALDACETSILNGHDIDLAGFRTHVATSPLIAELAATPAERESVVSVMVFGTAFLCPADAAQWQAAWDASAGAF